MSDITAWVNEPHKAFLRYKPTNTVYLIDICPDARAAMDLCQVSESQYNCSNTLFVEADSGIHLDAKPLRWLLQNLAIAPTLAMIGFLVGFVILMEVF
jgi:hypothetical protein